MGVSKLTLPLGSKRVIEWILEAASLSLLDQVILVVRPDDQVVSEIGRMWKARVIVNPDYQQGLSTSIQKALAELDSRGKDMAGFCLILGDQPFINCKIINQLIEVFERGKKEIVVPYYQAQRGNPVLFDMAWKPDLMKITGDVGGRVFIKKYPEKIKRVDIPDQAILFDIDRKEDYLEAKMLLERKERSR